MQRKRKAMLKTNLNKQAKGNTILHADINAENETIYESKLLCMHNCSNKQTTKTKPKPNLI